MDGGKTLWLHVVLYTLRLVDESSSQQPVKILGLNEGDVCRVMQASVPEYVCTRHDKCKPLKKMINIQEHPDVCSFVGPKPIVCCPSSMAKISVPDMKQGNPNVVNEKCDQYIQLAKKYRKISTNTRRRWVRRSSTNKLPGTKIGAMVPAVFGGIEATPMEFPHMVLLGFGVTANEPQWGCGGSLISERWILTAAHCQRMGLHNTARWARVGDLNIILKTEKARPKDYRIVRHVIHPDYKPPSRYNDIALFQTDVNVEFSAYVRPICLNTDPQLNPKIQIATGWGRTSTAGPTSADLLKVDLNVIQAGQCNNSYYSIDDQQLQFGILEDSMICAGSVNGDKDTCSGDSGGPLQTMTVDNPKTYTQFGITSFGKFCGDKDAPGVYTRVSRYIPWIAQIVWPN